MLPEPVSHLADQAQSSIWSAFEGFLAKSRPLADQNEHAKTEFGRPMIFSGWRIKHHGKAPLISMQHEKNKSESQKDVF